MPSAQGGDDEGKMTLFQFLGFTEEGKKEFFAKISVVDGGLAESLVAAFSRLEDVGRPLPDVGLEFPSSDGAVAAAILEDGHGGTGAGTQSATGDDRGENDSSLGLERAPNGLAKRDVSHSVTLARLQPSCKLPYNGNISFLL